MTEINHWTFDDVPGFVPESCLSVNEVDVWVEGEKVVVKFETGSESFSFADLEKFVRKHRKILDERA